MIKMESDTEAQRKPKVPLTDPLQTGMPSYYSSGGPTLTLVGAETKKPEASSSSITYPPIPPIPVTKTKNKDDKPAKPKRAYNKKRVSETENGDFEKPAPKKRGRKSKKELELIDSMPDAEKPQRKKKPVKGSKSANANKSPIDPSSMNNSKKSSLTKPVKPRKKQTGTSLGPSMFDNKLFVGPHLTMKQVLEYILTDHSYCVPPDPLPAVGSNHQMIRFIFGPKNGAKAKPLSVMGMMEPGDRSPIIYPGLSRARGQHGLSSTPSSPSKLENLLKRGDASPHSTSLRLMTSKNMDNRDESDVEIDVECVDPEPERRIAYDVQKAREVMNECGKYVEFARGTDTGENWESKVLRTGWTKSQSGMFDKVVGALHAERLARLAYGDIGDAEPVLRRASLDRTACRVRRIFGEYLWDLKLTQWLHAILNEYLNFDYLAIYLDVLQTLKSQCPQLVSRMMELSVILPLQNAYGCANEISNLLTPYMDAESESKDSKIGEPEPDPLAESPMEQDDSSQQSRFPTINENSVSEDILLPERSVVPQMTDAMQQLHSAKNAEALKALLGRQWDPFSPVLMQRLKKLSSNPVFIYITPGAILPKFTLNRRLKQYERMFRRVGQVFRIRPNTVEALKCTSASSYLEKIFHLAKEKIKQVRQLHSDRPLYLVGWDSGSILAARLSVTVGPVDGIVALGFPLHSLKEMQEDILKSFSGIKHPILFVIGGLASNNCLTDMELFRRRLACETSLVVIGSGNENLYVARDHREKLLVTQSYVDKNIMDEIAYFVNLHSKHNQIMTANISMKPPQFSKSQSSSADLMLGKKPTVARAKKRKASVSAADNGYDLYKDGKSPYYDGSTDRGFEAYPSSSTTKTFNPLLAGYDYDFGGPMSNPLKSSNKRKGNYKPDSMTPVPPTISSPITSSGSSCLTASQLVQQSPTAKRRMSKPSGPIQKTPLPLLGQPSTTAPGQVPDLSLVDSAGHYKYQSSTSTSGMDQNQQTTPLMQRKNDSVSVSDSSATTTPISKQNASEGKSGKKRPSSKKSGGVSSKASTPNGKDQSIKSPTSAMMSAISDVASSASATSVTGPLPTSSLDMHKYVMQHQQMVKQLEQNRPQNSQLFKLLSPGDSDSSSTSTSLASSSTGGGGDVVKLKLIGSQQLSSSDVMDARTAFISKQSLVSNMSLPMIRLARSGSLTEVSSSSIQQPMIVSSSSTSGSTVLSTLPSEVGEKILLRPSDKSIKLNANELKQLIAAGGRGIQLFTGAPGQSPLNIVVKRPQESSEETATTSVPALISTAIASASNISTGSQEVVGITSSSVDTDSLISTSSPNSSITQVPSPSETPDMPDVKPVIPSVVPVELAKAEESGEISQTLNDSTSEAMEPVAPVGVDTPLVEQPDVEEGADADTDDDDMCGIRISSCFSVCPTSGERVNQVVTPLTTTAADITTSSTVPVISSTSGGVVLESIKSTAATADESPAIPTGVEGGEAGTDPMAPENIISTQDSKSKGVSVSDFTPVEKAAPAQLSSDQIDSIAASVASKVASAASPKGEVSSQKTSKKSSKPKKEQIKDDSSKPTPPKKRMAKKETQKISLSVPANPITKPSKKKRTISGDGTHGPPTKKVSSSPKAKKLKKSDTSPVPAKAPIKAESSKRQLSPSPSTKKISPSPKPKKKLRSSGSSVSSQAVSECSSTTSADDKKASTRKSRTSKTNRESSTLASMSSPSPVSETPTTGEVTPSAKNEKEESEGVVDATAASSDCTDSSAKEKAEKKDPDLVSEQVDSPCPSTSAETDDIKQSGSDSSASTACDSKDASKKPTRRSARLKSGV